MEKELYEQAINLVQQLFINCDPMLKTHIFANGDSVKLAVPDVFLRFFAEGVEKLYGLKDQSSSSKRHVFRGVEIIPNYEMSIVLFHKDYPKVKEPWMVCKVWLETPRYFKPPLVDVSEIS